MLPNKPTTKESTDFQVVLTKLCRDYPDLAFDSGESFYWSPANRRIVYKQTAQGLSAIVSLLHEVGHAILDHKYYRLDLELLQLEIAAWEQAKRIAPRYHIAIEEDHVQDCLDSYRDWLHRRSICPSCVIQAIQQDDGAGYRCFNCRAYWRVAPSRFCRPYRRQSGQATPDAVLA